METLFEKYQALEVALRIRIASKIIDKGIKSKHRSDKVLRVKQGDEFYLEGERYLTEITAQELIDNDGYSYPHSALPMVDLCKAVDNA